MHIPERWVPAMTLTLITAAACAGAPKSQIDPPSQMAATNADTATADDDDAWIDPELLVQPASVPPKTATKGLGSSALGAQSVAPNIVIRGGTVMTATGERYEDGVVILEGGRIRYVGSAADVGDWPRDARVVDASGRYVTPGIIDRHSHIGVYSVPSVHAHADGNETTSPVTASARAEYAYWPQDPAIPRAMAGGVTSALVLPGSANLVGGRGFTVVMRPGRVADEVAFPGAPPTLKMACGENPKRVYGNKGGPATRMGEYAYFRAAFQEAREYLMKWALYRVRRSQWTKKRLRASQHNSTHGGNAAGSTNGSTEEPRWKRDKAASAPDVPQRDLMLETLAGVLRGEILVQVHCYRADEMRQMVAIAEEFGFQIRSFHHALEAYKVRDILVHHDIAINTWADWWGFKMEAFDGIRENAGLFAESGGRTVIHSDSAIGIQRLNQEAAKAMYAARAAGIDITEDEALRWVTANPAWVLGIDEITGTLEKGKRADVVLWSAHPFSVYARADLVIQGGQVAYERRAGRPQTDFELGNSAAVGGTLQPSAKRMP